MKYWLILILSIYPAAVIGENSSPLARLLSDQELSYLENIEFLTVCNVAQAASDQASYDLVKLILKNTNINLRATESSSWSVSYNNLLNKQCDILPWATEIKERLDIMSFTRPYARVKRVIVTKKDKSYIRSISEIENKIFASLKGTHVTTQLLREYPDLKLVHALEADNVLDLIANEEVFGGIASMYSVANLFDNAEFSDLKIAGILPPNYDDVVSLATRKNDQLLGQILEKILVIADKKSIDRFMSQGAVTTIKPSLNYSDYWFQIILVIIAGLILVGWNRRLSSLNHQLKFAHIELENKSKELERLSITDPLTGTFNRLKIDSVFSQEISRSNRYKSNLAIFMIDIDYFKKINDQYGHLIGDEVLSKFAKLLQDNIRVSDFLGRWGGEEFLVICPNTNLAEVEVAAEKLRGLIEQSDFSPVEKVTASFGVTEWVTGDSQATLVSKADYAMYLSKQHGRNRVSISANRSS